MLRTLNCCNCHTRRAEGWGGHVHHAQVGFIMAGWCGGCESKPSGSFPGGCQGDWRPANGLGVHTGEPPHPRVMVFREDDDPHHGLHEIQ